MRMAFLIVGFVMSSSSFLQMSIVSDREWSSLFSRFAKHTKPGYNAIQRIASINIANRVKDVGQKVLPVRFLKAIAAHDDQKNKVE